MDYGIKPEAPSQALLIGSAYHAAMKWVGNNWEHVKKDPVEVSRGIRSVAETFIESIPIDMMSIAEEHAFGLACCHAEKLLSLPTWKFLEVEKSFQLPAGGRVFSGQIDGIVELDGRRLLLEHKTKANIPSNLLDLLPVDGQLMRYWFAMAHESLDGVLYTVARKSQIRRKKETLKQPEETIDEFVGRLRSEYKEAGATAVTHTEFVIDNDDVRECMRSTVQTIDLIAHYDKISRYPKHEHACEGKYGPCEFFGPCQKTHWDGSQLPAGFLKKTAKHEEIEERMDD
ncbi:MAG: hypothetical protein UY48_C0003G0076 [Candidatus Gottesmanbacteria bacterium GW2011_GWB1_49_7]|uniref:PD-(D/E)XK endonuclease-like domain-containing protein n=1 Tax=Candidatus Gottesmanbacteria bacterium GW2011_GWB1_49_7 TaxID=1618448 RepID=A0A0G1Z3A3_9BACT|nr:MAG: hypothetical protein UY48_C0003G0076 [Candidatus Gottesmanbacteria bacterium GW2011_GWB1_49_7]